MSLFSQALALAFSSSPNTNGPRYRTRNSPSLGFTEPKEDSTSFRLIRASTVALSETAVTGSESSTALAARASPVPGEAPPAGTTLTDPFLGAALRADALGFNPVASDAGEAAALADAFLLPPDAIGALTVTAPSPGPGSSATYRNVVRRRPDHPSSSGGTNRVVRGSSWKNGTHSPSDDLSHSVQPVQGLLNARSGSPERRQLSTRSSCGSRCDSSWREGRYFSSSSSSSSASGIP